MEDLKTFVDPKELVKLCAVDNDLFARSFFPAAARQRSPSFHKEMDELLDNPKYRLVNMRCFRDSAKTTKLRIFTAKRIAYGISRTILYVGASEGHASRSVQWIRAQIDHKRDATGEDQPTFFGGTFDLHPGRKWSETEIEIEHRTFGHVVWVLGVGITGNIRGINFDNYRPDLIILDDIVTDENAATESQRDKVTDLVYGALVRSLAPATEEPNAKLALLQTPLHAEDVSATASSDTQFTTAIYGCWTKETSDLPLDQQESAWPERHPTLTLRKEKLAAARINQLAKFAREMECKLTTPEACPFRPEWLQYYEGDAPQGGMTILAIDPVPPLSDVQRAKDNMKDKDFEAHTVWRRVKGEYYLVDYRIQRGHEPNWSVATAFTLAMKYRVSRIVVESIAYQRVLKWLIEQEMKRRGIYFVIKDTKDRRPKFMRITSTLAGPASQGHIWVSGEHIEFIEQFTTYTGRGDHDDLLDSSAIGLSDLINPYLELADDEYSFDDDNIPKLKRVRGCP